MPGVVGVLRVLTLNIWNLSEPWPGRRAEIVRWIDDLAPDVVCLQEVVDDGDGRNQADRLAAAASGEWHVAWAGTPVAGGARVGNAVLSRQPIATTSWVELPNDRARDDVDRLVVHARTGGVDVYAFHLSWRFDVADLRRRQVLALDRFVADTADPDGAMPAVVAGDANAEPDSDEVRFLSGLATIDGAATYFQDAWRVAGGRGAGWTWDNRNPFAARAGEPDRRIDYVFVGWRKEGGAGRVLRTEVVCDVARTGTFASDHFGLLADLAAPG